MGWDSEPAKFRGFSGAEDTPECVAPAGPAGGGGAQSGSFTAQSHPSFSPQQGRATPLRPDTRSVRAPSPVPLRGGESLPGYKFSDLAKGTHTFN